MKALQYIYTSWKNGNSEDKGYMIYSRSEGITEEECITIKAAMQYLAPKGLNPTPSPKEIEDIFPYSFAYFLLPGGRQCVAQTTYLGKDYSGRFGNYIIYGLVFEAGEMECRPGELFAESYIKTTMTDEELNASSPVPPLPQLEISEYGSVVNDEQLNEFLFEREREFAQLLASLLTARERKIPFYINDTRENLVQWVSAVQRILPDKLAYKFTFNTYVGNHEGMCSAHAKELGLDFYLLGVRPDANYFQYATECQSNRYIVIDFLNGYMTKNILIGSFAQNMAASGTIDFSEADEFSAFLNRTSLETIDQTLENAYKYYAFLRRNELEDMTECVDIILQFGFQYGNAEDNSNVGSKLIVQIQEKGDILSLKRLYQLWLFICKYVDFMVFALYDLTLKSFYQTVCDINEPCKELDTILRKMKTETLSEYKGLLKYLNNSDNVRQILLYLKGHPNPYTSLFYFDWIMHSYRLKNGFKGEEPICKLLQELFANISRLRQNEEYLINILFSAITDRVMFESMLQVILVELHNPEEMESFCNVYSRVVENKSIAHIRNFEQMLFQVSGAEEFIIMFFAYKIRVSENPEEEFWNFYQYQKTVRNKNLIFLDQIVLACLETLDGSVREKAAIRMLEKLDINMLKETACADILINFLSKNKVKTLIKMDSSILQQAYQLHINMKSCADIEKIEAVLVGKKIQEVQGLGQDKVLLSDKIGKKVPTLVSFEKNDYDTYIKSFLSEYINFICSVEDVGIVLELFYNKKFYHDFADSYISFIAKLRKKDESKWEHMLSWTGNFLIINTENNKLRHEMEIVFIKYLGNLSEEEVFSVKEELAKKLPESQVISFFNKVQHRKGVQERLGNLFRRK